MPFLKQVYNTFFYFYVPGHVSPDSDFHCIWPPLVHLIFYGDHYLSSLMPIELNESRESVYRHQATNSSDNLKARAAHLVLDDDAQSILNQIFPPTEENGKGMTRRVVGTDEDPSGGASTSRRVLVIVPNLWTSLAKDYFNNPAW